MSGIGEIVIAGLLALTCVYLAINAVVVTALAISVEKRVRAIRARDAANSKSPDVFEIHPNGRYILQFQDFLPDDVFLAIQEDLEQWQHGNRKFMVLRGGEAGVKIVRVDNADIEIGKAEK